MHVITVAIIILQCS